MPAPLPHPRAVVFDWDNTLVDSWLCIQKTYNATLRHFGLPEWSMDRTKQQVAASMRDSFPAMFGPRWPEAREVFTSAFAAIHLDHLHPLPGAEALLDDLGARGVTLAVVSNKRGHFLRLEAEVLGWSGRFNRLVGAEDAEADKPDPAAVRLALDGSGLTPGPEVWFVGDSPIDIECAARSGCTPVLVGATAPDRESFAYAPARAVPDCDALARLLAELAVPICFE